ncbi:MAG: hypothetical protein Q8930_11820, partial [Bacillota bacterium]|nr:hypothetical protein [Bacillota bacterium]
MKASKPESIRTLLNVLDIESRIIGPKSIFTEYISPLKTAENEWTGDDVPERVKMKIPSMHIIVISLRNNKKNTITNKK